MTVYLILDAADIWTTHAIFSTKEKAEKFIDARLNEYPWERTRFHISEMVVDEYAAKD